MAATTQFVFVSAESTVEPKHIDPASYALHSKVIAPGYVQEHNGETLVYVSSSWCFQPVASKIACAHLCTMLCFKSTSVNYVRGCGGAVHPPSVCWRQGCRNYAGVLFCVRPAMRYCRQTRLYVKNAECRDHAGNAKNTACDVALFPPPNLSPAAQHPGARSQRRIHFERHAQNARDRKRHQVEIRLRALGRRARHSYGSSSYWPTRAGVTYPSIDSEDSMGHESS